MSSYKMVDDRVELARRLEALIEENAETTARTLAAVFAGLSDVPEEVWYETELQRQRLLVRLVARLRQTMVGAADGHRAEEEKLDALRARRDATVAELYAELLEVRRQARCFYPDRAATIVGLRGRTRRKPWPLVRQARLAVDCLADFAAGADPAVDAESADGAKTRSEIEASRRRTWRETLAPLQAAIGPALEAVAHGKAATIGTLKVKLESMKDFDRRFGRVGRYVKSAYELAGLDELAARVPPRVARKDRRKSAAKPRLSEETASLPQERLFGLAEVVDLGRWVKRRLLRLGRGEGRRQAGTP